MEANHRIKNYHDAMEELQRTVNAQPAPQIINPVPCDGCTLCCRGDAIRLLPQDDPALFATEPHERFPGHLMIAHRENGDCIYLHDDGCACHDSKPTMCQEMDCRELARKLKKKDLARYGVPLAVWNRGRQMIGRGW